MVNDHKLRMQEYISCIEAYLNGCFCNTELPQKALFEGMRYSLLAGGKRLRPIFTLEFARLCGGDWKKAIPVAAAVEMVHTYSLIHDDLPCMDNDDYRRGRLTNHKVFGEAAAVLAGDALLTAAFGYIAASELDADVRIDCVAVLSQCAGELGMVGGQVLDMEGEHRALNTLEMHTVHRLKTGCLISAACRMGVIAAGGNRQQLEAAGAYADAFGLAFQIRDDMLDVLGDAEKLGKATHADENKNTFVTHYGLDACREMIAEETAKAASALEIFPEREFLVELAKQMALREY